MLPDNDSARIAVALRLGNKVCKAHLCICREVVNPKGIHKISYRKFKHSEVNKLFSIAVSAAGFLGSLEPYGLSRRGDKDPTA